MKEHALHTPGLVKKSSNLFQILKFVGWRRLRKFGTMDVAFSGRSICLACVKALSQSLHKKKKKN